MNKFVMPHGDYLVAPEAANWVGNLLAQMESPEFARDFTQKVNEVSAGGNFWEELEGSYMSRYRPYNVENGVLTIPVKGMLMKGLPFQMGGMATGYEYVVEAVKRGVGDYAVRQIVLDVNSPGGTVAGAFDAADFIYESRGTKPIRAVANEAAYSAAYAIASAADDITVARTGGVGSIGVYTAHADMSEMLAKQGVKITQIFKGAAKADGQPFAPLSESAKRKMEDRINGIHILFVNTVARNRGLDPKTVEETESETFTAQEAVEKGLADTVGTLDSLSAPADSSQDQGTKIMSKENAPALTQADLDTAVAAARAEGETAGKAEGRTEERARVSAILDGEAAKSHPAAAMHVALNTDMSAESAEAFLAGLPEEKSAQPAATAGNAFDAAMQNSGNPDLGAAPTGGDAGTQLTTPDSIFASAGFPSA